MRTLTDTETWSIANALRVAADQYEQDAAFYSDDNAKARGETMSADARARLVRVFEDQAKTARELAGLLEGADHVKVAA